MRQFDRAWAGVFVVACVLVRPGAGVAQEGAQRFRSEAVGVVVDAVVRDAHGRLLRCLSKSDFRLTEDGIEQPIEGFELVASTPCGNSPPDKSGPISVAVEATTAPAVTAIVFEELGPEARGAAFHAAQAFLRNRQQPNEFVGIFTLDFALHTTVPYTRDESALIDGLRRAAMRPGCPVTVTGTIAKADDGSPCEPPPGGEVKVKETLSGLQAAVRTLAALPGRKNVLIFSEGFRVSTAESAIDELERLIAAANQHGVTLHTIDALGLRTIDGRQATRQRLSAYTGSSNAPGALAAAGENANALLASDPTTALARLAQGTGGEFVSDTNDLDGAVRELAGEMHEYYRLSYQPTTQASNRGYHHLVVTVSAPGAVVRTRAGYYTELERRRDVPVVGSAEAAPHLMLDAGTTPRDFVMTESVHDTGREVEVRVDVPAAGLTFRTADGRFQAGGTILARAVGSDKNVLASASDSFALSGAADGLPSARARTVRFAKTLARKDARTIEIIAYDILGHRACVERHELRGGRK